MSVIIASPEAGDLGTLTTGNELTNMPASNLLRDQPWDIWRTSDLANMSLIVDLGSVKGIGLVWLGFTNSSSTGQFRVRGATSEANLTASPGYDSGLLDIWEYTDMEERGFESFHATLILPSIQNFQWWRVDVTDNANVDGYFQAGRLIISEIWTPSRGIQFGYRPPGVIGRSQLQESDQANLYVNKKKSGIESEFVFRFDDSEINEVDTEIAPLDRKRGDRTSILFILQSQVTGRIPENTIYGVQQPMRASFSPTYRVFEKRYSIKGFT